MDIKMAWRNIGRNPMRSILTISAIAFASMLLVFMLSWQFGSYETMINSSVKVYTGHIQIQAQGYKDKGDMHLVISSPETVANILDNMPEVANYTLRAKAFSLISSKDRTYGTLITGISPNTAAQVFTIENLIRKGSYLSENDTDQAILGSVLAKNLKVDIGDELTLLGQGRDGSIAAAFVTVKGIFSSGQDEFDRSSIYIPLRFFQDVYFMNQAVHETIIVTDSIKNIPMLKQNLVSKIKNIKQRPPLVTLDWDELMPGLRQGINLDLYSGLINYLILIIVVAFSILNTFLMAIFERTKEFGIFLAIGTRPGRLTKLLLIESFIMIIIGETIGIILGSLITWYTQIHGFSIAGTSEILKRFGMPGRMYPQLSLLSVSIGPVIVFVITFLVSLYPAFKVRRLRMVDTLAHS